jgi:putative adenylate-forming enzyme
MNKTIMMEKFNEVNTVGLDRDALLKFLMEREDKGLYDLFLHNDTEYSVGMSSGTSGNRGITVLSKTEITKYSLVLFMRSGIPAQVKKKHILFLLRVNNPSFMAVKRFGVKIVYSDYTKSAAELVDIINTEQLNILAGPPTLLSLIAALREKIVHTIDCLISYAEILTDDVKQFLADSFGCPVVEIYQGSEGFIASCCKEGNLHINEDLIELELEDMGNGMYKVVVTDLYRETQPIVKYELNDLIELEEKRCPCGSSFKRIKQIHGRMDDVFIFKTKDTNEEVFLFPDYVRRAIISASDSIIEYQAIQHDYQNVEIRLQLSDLSQQQSIESTIIANIANRCSQIGIEVPVIEFSASAPELHPVSKKMIRVQRRFIHDTTIKY